MIAVDDFVARIDGTCGKEQDVIVTFKFEKRDEAMRRMLGKAKIEKSIAKMVYELSYRNHFFRLYRSGKAIFRSIESKEQLNELLGALLT